MPKTGPIEQARSRTRQILDEAGVVVPAHLPLLDPIKPRSRDEVIARMLCLHVIIYLAYDFPRDRAADWLAREGLMDSLTDYERRYLLREGGERIFFKNQIEQLWTLAWSLGLVDDLDFWSDLQEHLVSLMPDIHEGRSSDALRKIARLRSKEEILEALDLAYCLHWAVRNAEIHRNPPPAGLKPHIVIERRHALEWLAGEMDWDDLDLDT